jgi:hypothetical protein
MRANNPANADDVQRMLGDIDPLIAERILSTGATVDEIDEALREIEDERGFGEAIHVASSPRVSEVRAVLDELEVLDQPVDELDEIP